MTKRSKPGRQSGDSLYDQIMYLQGGFSGRPPVDITTVWGDPEISPKDKLRKGRTFVGAWDGAGSHINLKEIVFDDDATHSPTVETRLEFDEWDLERGNFGQETTTIDSPGPFYAPDRVTRSIGPEERTALIVKIAEAVGRLTQPAG